MNLIEQHNNMYMHNMQIFGLVLLIIVVVVGAGTFWAPQLTNAQYGSFTFAKSVPVQQDQQQEWKTYVNPEYKFTMQYPYSGEGKFLSNDHGIMITTTNDMLDSDTPFLMFITPKNGTGDNIISYVQSWLQDDIRTIDNRTTVFEPIHPIVYANTSGYEYVTYDGWNGLLGTSIFLDNGEHVLGFRSSDSIDDYNLDDFKNVVGSIKFFD